MAKVSVRWSLAIGDVLPGTPAYQSYRDLLMPIEVDLGCSLDDGEECYSWIPGQEVNGFMMVTGGSGSGKTEALKRIGASLAEHGIPLVTIDFHGDVIFKGQNSVTLQARSGRRAMGMARSLGLNPLAIESSFVERVGLGTKISREVDRIGRATGGMGYKQAICLRHLIIETYRNFSIYVDDSSSWRNEPPTLKDLSEIILGACEEGMDGFEKQTLTACYAKVETLACNAVFCERDWLSVEDMLALNLRLDCSLLGREARLLAVETVLEMIFEAGKVAGSIPVNPVSDAERYRVFVMIDEAKILSLGRGNAEDSKHILNILITEGRKYGIGLILASQVSAHFSSEVHANVSTRLALKRMDPKEAKKVAPQMGLLPEDLVSMESPPGTAFFRSASTGGTVLLQVSTAPPMGSGTITQI